MEHAIVTVATTALAMWAFLNRVPPERAGGAKRKTVAIKPKTRADARVAKPKPTRKPRRRIEITADEELSAVEPPYPIPEDPLRMFSGDPRFRDNAENVEVQESDYGLFRVKLSTARVLAGKRNPLLILFRNRWHVAIPSPVSGVARRLPIQHSHSCYAFAAMNALLNQTVFCTRLIEQIERKMRENPYSRREGESDETLHNRRFGTGVLETLVSGNYGRTSSNDFRSALKNIDRDDVDLVNWMTLRMILGILQAGSRRERGWRKSNRVQDAELGFIYRRDRFDFNSDNNLSLAYKAVKWGNSIRCLLDILVKCGAKYRRRVTPGENSSDFVARLDDGTSLVVGRHWHDKYNHRDGKAEDYTEIKCDGAYTGLASFHKDASNLTRSGHVVAWTRDSSMPEDVTIVDSNGKFYFWDVAKSLYRAERCFVISVFTTWIPAPFEAGELPLVDGDGDDTMLELAAGYANSELSRGECTELDLAVSGVMQALGPRPTGDDDDPRPTGDDDGDRWFTRASSIA